MMTYSDDHIALAAEYALGTLDADERALVETMMIVDHGFREIVDAWDRKLAPLHQMVAPVEPPAHLWEKIKTAAGLSGEQAPIILPVDHDDEIVPTRHFESIRHPELAAQRPNVLQISDHKRGGGYAFGSASKPSIASNFAVGFCGGRTVI